VLSPLQDRIRLTLAGAADEVDLALAGGGGLVLSGVVDRRTRDLDFFARYPSPQTDLVDRVQAVLEADGLRVAREEESDHFARLRVTSADGSTTIDVGADYRLEPPVRIKDSNVLALADLAADKVLTLWARALPRDFVDFAALSERFSVAELCALASRKDGGFRPVGPEGLGAVLAAFPSRAPSAYAEFPVDYHRLAATIAAAAAEISRLFPPTPSLGVDI